MLQRVAKQVARPASASSGAEPLLAPPSRPATAAERPRLRFTDLAIDAPHARPSRPNRTGLPDRLKSGIEALSGVSLDAVKVRYNSPAPARLGALAYAQGREIHLAAGQEQHLPHEAWHLVQQAQGRVRPTGRLDGKVAVNDDRGLEREADHMGAKAWSAGGAEPAAAPPALAAGTASPVLQPVLPTAAQFEQQFGQRGTWYGMRSAFTDPHLHAAHAAISSYHSVPWLTQWRGAQAVNEHKLAALHAAQHSLYNFQNAQVANPGHPAAAGVAALQNEIQDTHRGHIATSVAGGHRLWTPDAATMAPLERQRVDDLWSSVTTGADTAGTASNLRVHNQTLVGNAGQAPIAPAGFRDEINANHARLLETPGGRDLLQSLVQGPRPVDVRPSHVDDRADTGYVMPGRTAAVPGSPQEANREALASAIPNALGVDTMVHRPGPPGGAAVETRYDHAAGKSSRVIMNPGIRDADMTHHDDTSHDVRKGGNPVPSPAFLIYGHELGHARNVMRGEKKMAMRPDLYDSAQIPALDIAARTALGPDTVVPAHQQMLMNWDNAEEHDIIENVENPLRDEHGLPRRKYH